MNKIKFFAISSIFILSACGSDGSTPTSASRVGASGFVASDTPAPPLEISSQELDSAMKCREGFGPDSGRAVLLVPGATQTVESNFSWNYIPAFDKAGIPWCAVDLPNSNTGELQASSEYITHAIRKMFNTTKTKIAIVGFSQGGVIALHLLPRLPYKLAGVMALSTYMAVPGKLKEEMTGVNKSTAVLVNHGTHDEVVPYSAGQAAFNALKFAGFTVNWAEYRMGHSVCPQQIADISRFIQQQLPAL